MVPKALWLKENEPAAFDADAPALGSAILAAVGAGLYDDIPTASDNMVQVVRQIEPDPAQHEAYQPYYQAYKDTYPALAELLHRQAGGA